MIMDIHHLLIDFRITSSCHLDCDLCFRNPGIKEAPLTSVLQVIERMYKMGFRRIGFTGGEPVLRADALCQTARVIFLPFPTGMRQQSC